jgi:hypothetical protein
MVARDRELGGRESGSGKMGFTVDIITVSGK